MIFHFIFCYDKSFASLEGKISVISSACVWIAASACSEFYAVAKQLSQGKTV